MDLNVVAYSDKRAVVKQNEVIFIGKSCLFVTDSKHWRK